MKIDLSHIDLSKIQAKDRPDKPGLWWRDTPGEGAFAVHYCDDDFNRYLKPGEYRFLCEFVPPSPKVIPPKPELVCVEYTADNDQLGWIGWGILEAEGDAWVLIDGIVYCFNAGNYKIIEQ